MHDRIPAGSPTVSVIIPTYNYGRFVADALRSVLCQTFGDLEVIVVNDGSTDETQQVLDGFDDPRLRRVHVSNGGNSVSINIGLEMARGEFIAVLDADDRWLPTKLERQVEVMRSEPGLGAVFCDFARFDERGYFPKTQFSFFPELRAVPRRPTRAGGGFVITSDAFETFVPFVQFPAWMQTMMLRAEQVRGIWFHPRIRRSADMHYMHRVYRRIRAGFVPEVLAEVRRHGNNSYTSALQKLVADAEVRGLILKEEPLRADHREILRRRTGRAFCDLGFSYFWDRDPLRALHAYSRSLRYPGSRVNALKHLMLTPAVPFLRPRAEMDWDEPVRTDARPPCTLL